MRRQDWNNMYEEGVETEEMWAKKNGEENITK